MAIDASFEHMLKIGQTGEDVISCWFRSRGWSVLPVYPVVEDANKGPRLYTAAHNPQKELVAPDMLAMKGAKIQWLEAKRKSKFAWYAKGGAWQTGIDRRLFDHYLKVSEVTQLPVWLLFLHVDSTPSVEDLQRKCIGVPSIGLFGNEIKALSSKIQEGEFKNRYRPNPMVFWSESQLRKIASLQDVKDAVWDVKFGL